jgi:hypothetical protein
MKSLTLKRTRVEVMKSIDIMLDYYDKYMIDTGNNKLVSREQLYMMFKDYHDWLQGK